MASIVTLPNSIFEGDYTSLAEVKTDLQKTSVEIQDFAKDLIKLIGDQSISKDFASIKLVESTDSFVGIIEKVERSDQLPLESRENLVTLIDQERRKIVKLANKIINYQEEKSIAELFKQLISPETLVKVALGIISQRVVSFASTPPVRMVKAFGGFDPAATGILNRPSLLLAPMPSETSYSSHSSSLSEAATKENEKLTEMIDDSVESFKNGRVCESVRQAGEAADQLVVAYKATQESWKAFKDECEEKGLNPHIEARREIFEGDARDPECEGTLGDFDFDWDNDSWGNDYDNS